MEVGIGNQRIDEEKFLRMRDEVLAQWPTGKEVDLEEAVDYQRSLPESKNFCRVVQKLREEGRTVVFPRGGTPIIEDEIELNRTMVQAGVPLIPVTSDSYTRALQFSKVQAALEESTRTGKPLLNGYPLINHGVKNTRRVVEAVDAAFNPRLSRLANPLGAEIAFAAGMTGLNASPHCLFGSYEKKTPLEDCIKSSQYVFRLMGHYAERGPILTSDLHGWLPCSVFPASLLIATMIADALIAAEQGVRSVIPLVQYFGHMPQDVAWTRVAPRLMRKYLDDFGYRDVVIPGVIANQMPLFPMPQDVGGAFAYLNYTAMVAALAKAEAVFVRTIDEGAGIPTKEAHAASYRSAKWIFDVVRTQKIEIDEKEIATEAKVTEIEVTAILDAVLKLGDGDIVLGVIRGVEAGVLDSPFCPNVNVKDKVLGVRDLRGACRYLEFGNLPIPEEIKEFHREKVAERASKEQRKMDYYVAVDDLWAFSKGQILGTRAGS